MMSCVSPLRFSLTPLVASILLAGCVVSGDDSVIPPRYYGDADAPQLGSLPVVRVIDGDTIEVDMEGVTERVRMKGVDTPELHPQDNPSVPEPYAEAARAYTSTHVGTEVDLEFDSRCGATPLVGCRDAFDRLLAYVRIVDGSDLGASLLAEGLARVYVYQGESFDRKALYLELQAQAQADSVGLWSGTP